MFIQSYPFPKSFKFKKILPNGNKQNNSAASCHTFKTPVVMLSQLPTSVTRVKGLSIKIRNEGLISLTFVFF